VLATAFDDDPWFNFVAAQDARRRDRLRGWLDRGLRLKTFPLGETYMTADGNAVALWIPPGLHGDGAAGSIELWKSLARASGLRRTPRVAAAIRQIGACEPSTPHMELRLLAVDPKHRRQHLASALMNPMLTRCDEQRMPAALLCTKRENVALYEHFDFRVTHEIQIAGGSMLWQMLRDPPR